MKPYPYQLEGIDFLRSHSRAYLADEMGLGKTVQSLVAVADEDRVLVIAPAAALGNWRKEIVTWGNGQHFDVMSYADRRLRDGDVDGSTYGAVILDEAHYLKSRKAKRTRYVFDVAKGSPRVILLSGTPMPNNATELWTMFDALWPDMLDGRNHTFHKWLNHFTRWRPTKYGPKVYGHKNAVELKHMLESVMLRRKLRDVALDLPSLRVTLHTLPAVSEFTRGLDDAARLTLAEMAAEEAQTDASISRIRRLLGALKAPMIAETLRTELSERQYNKIVVLYYHKDVGNTLEAALESFGVVRMDGSTPATKRQGMIDAFTDDSGVRVFLGQQQSAGEALNLQAASEVVLVEPAWTPDANRQAIKRVHRIGQKDPCRARMFGVEGTLDEAVMKVILLKTQLQTTVGLR